MEALTGLGGHPESVGGYKGLGLSFAGADCPSRPQYTIRTSSASDDGVIEPNPSQIAALPAFSDFRESSTAPLILTGDPRVNSQILMGTSDPSGQLPMNYPCSLETDLFFGRLLVNVKGMSGTPKNAFSGTKWLGKTVIQGQFKKCIPAEDVWVGQELWNKPLLPPSFQKVVFATAAKFFSNTSRITTEGEGVGFLNPLLAMSQVVNVSRPGCEPDLSGPVQEDMRLLSSKLTDRNGNAMSSSQRQKHFDKLSNLATIEFDDRHVYTFIFGQSILDLLQYKLSLGGFLTLDLCQILNGQPLQMMCKNVRDNRTVMSLLVWHERLNYPEGCAARSGGLFKCASRQSVASSSCSSNTDSSSMDAYGCSIDGCSSSTIDGCSSSTIDSYGSGSIDCCRSSCGSDSCSTGSMDGGGCRSGDSSIVGDDGVDSCSEYGSASSELASDDCSSTNNDECPSGDDCCPSSSVSDGDCSVRESCAARKLAAHFKTLWKKYS